MAHVNWWAFPALVWHLLLIWSGFAAVVSVVLILSLNVGTFERLTAKLFLIAAVVAMVPTVLLVWLAISFAP